MLHCELINGIKYQWLQCKQHIWIKGLCTDNVHNFFRTVVYGSLKQKVAHCHLVICCQEAECLIQLARDYNNYIILYQADIDSYVYILDILHVKFSKRHFMMHDYKTYETKDI